MNYLQTEIQRSGIFLLPLRIFMGLAWMRVGMEKLFDPQWHSGEEIRLFFSEQLQNGDVVFPFYQSLIHSMFEPAAGLLAGIILFAELYVGFAILFGCFTNFALIGGIFMNLNFMLVGSANPSIFYILIQAVLLGTNSGAVLGLDKWFSQRIKSWFLVAQPDYSFKNFTMHPFVLLAAAGVTFTSGLISVAYVKDKSFQTPDDPGLALGALCLVAGIMLCILAFRAHSTRKGTPSTNLSIYPYPENPYPEKFHAPSPRVEMGQNFSRALYAQEQPNSQAAPQMSVNDFATVLVPHNMVDTTVRDMKDVRETRRPLQSDAVHRNTKPAHTPATNILHDAINEMSTLLVPHNLSSKGAAAGINSSSSRLS